jgi:sterol desaturase/sphingolipid hydroxylase (fatty acid hydroxylase superfamily)
MGAFQQCGAASLDCRGNLRSCIRLGRLLTARHVSCRTNALEIAQVHHADLDFDVTTGLRFHTIEILLSFGIKATVTLLLGPPAIAVILFEVLLNVTAMFNHGNVRMPVPLDDLLRWIIVTPDMHRVHHSTASIETNSNFGFNLPWWDYWFGTYRYQPAKGHERMVIGLAAFRDEHQVERLHGMLLLPFIGQSANDFSGRRKVD